MREIEVRTYGEFKAIPKDCSCVVKFIGRIPELEEALSEPKMTRRALLEQLYVRWDYRIFNYCNPFPDVKCTPLWKRFWRCLRDTAACIHALAVFPAVTNFWRIGFFIV
jgi:hypothetical protein